MQEIGFRDVKDPDTRASSSGDKKLIVCFAIEKVDRTDDVKPEVHHFILHDFLNKLWIHFGFSLHMKNQATVVFVCTILEDIAFKEQPVPITELG